MDYQSFEMEYLALMHTHTISMFGRVQLYFHSLMSVRFRCQIKKSPW